MSTVVLMLDGESAILHQPKQPGFYADRSSQETEDSLDKERPVTNSMSISSLDGR